MKYFGGYMKNEHLASTNAIEVFQSFSVAIGKAMSSYAVDSQMGVIYNILSTRCVNLPIVIIFWD